MLVAPRGQDPSALVESADRGRLIFVAAPDEVRLDRDDHDNHNDNDNTDFPKTTTTTTSTFIISLRSEDRFPAASCFPRSIARWSFHPLNPVVAPGPIKLPAVLISPIINATKIVNEPQILLVFQSDECRIRFEAEQPSRTIAGGRWRAEKVKTTD